MQLMAVNRKLETNKRGMLKCKAKQPFQMITYFGSFSSFTTLGFSCISLKKHSMLSKGLESCVKFSELTLSFYQFCTPPWIELRLQPAKILRSNAPLKIAPECQMLQQNRRNMSMRKYMHTWPKVSYKLNYLCIR